LLSALLVATCWAALSASAASASNGEITRAEATAGWTQASIAGTVEWTGCEHWVEWEPDEWEIWPFEDYGELLEILEPPEFGEEFPLQYCGWLPYATVGPGSEPSDCASDDRDLFKLGAGVDLVWEGEAGTSLQQIFFETTSFDEMEVPLSDPDNRLVCLSMVEAAPEPAFVVCPQVEGVLCPQFVIAEFRHEIASAVLTCVDPKTKNQGSCTAGGHCGSPKGKGCLHRHRPSPAQTRLSELTLS